MKAEHSGANVLIHIKDDGAGIDPEKVRRKAIEKGWINGETEKNEKECLQMIFSTGLFDGRFRDKCVRSRRRNGCGETQHRRLAWFGGGYQ